MICSVPQINGTVKHFGRTIPEACTQNMALRNAHFTEPLLWYNDRMAIRKADTKLLPCDTPATAFSN